MVAEGAPVMRCGCNALFTIDLMQKILASSSTSASNSSDGSGATKEPGLGPGLGAGLGPGLGPALGGKAAEPAAPVASSSPVASPDLQQWLLRSYASSRRGAVVSYCKNPRGCSGVVLLADDAELRSTHCR